MFSVPFHAFAEKYLTIAKESAPACSTGNAIVNSAKTSTTNVTFKFSVTLNGGANITDCGIVYGTSQNNLNQHISYGAINARKGSFQVTKKLKWGTYYYCAYATNKMGTTYGAIKKVKVYSCLCYHYTGSLESVYSHCLSSGCFKLDPNLKNLYEAGTLLISRFKKIIWKALETKAY